MGSVKQQQQQQQINELGGCTLHPDIQLNHRKKNGEWRVLLHACPLCVSGLPATGHSISGGSRFAEDVLDNSTERGDENDVMKNKEGKLKKKKKHKSQIDNSSSHSDDGAGYSYNDNQEEAITDLDRKIQEKKILKQQKQQQSLESSSNGGRSGRAMSRTPPKSPSARPRSPSPQQSPLHMKQRLTATNNNIYYNEPPFTING